MDYRNDNLFIDDDDCLYGLCASMGSDEFLGATVITNLFSAVLFLVKV